jgi:hypothetical protein
MSRSPSDADLLAARRLLSRAERKALDDVLAVRTEATQLLESAHTDAKRIRAEAECESAVARAEIDAARRDLQADQAAGEAARAELDRVRAGLDAERVEVEINAVQTEVVTEHDERTADVAPTAVTELPADADRRREGAIAQAEIGHRLAAADDALRQAEHMLEETRREADAVAEVMERARTAAAAVVAEADDRRAVADRDVAELRARAQREVAELGIAAKRESDALRASAERGVDELLTSAAERSSELIADAEHRRRTSLDQAIRALDAARSQLADQDGAAMPTDDFPTDDPSARPPTTPRGRGWDSGHLDS